MDICQGFVGDLISRRRMCCGNAKLGSIMALMAEDRSAGRLMKAVPGRSILLEPLGAPLWRIKLLFWRNYRDIFMWSSSGRYSF